MLRCCFRACKYPYVARDGKGRIFGLADIERILAVTKDFTKSRNPSQEEVHRAEHLA
jgi:hypothetical protein